MKLIAHRGLYKTKSEQNTIKAFLNAIKNECYIGFEFDVRQTKDNKFVINHDADINNKLIKNTNYNELNILLLEKVLKINTNKIFVIEIKDSNVNTNLLNKILNKYKSKKIYVMSFHNKVIKKLSEEKHSYKLGILNYILNTEEKYRYDFICLLDKLVTKNQINNYLNKNVEVFIYGLLKQKELNHGNECYYIVDNFCINEL